MTARGHEVFFTARDKDRSVELLREFGLPFTEISRQRNGAIGRSVEMATRTRALLGVMRRFRPDVLTGIMGPSIAVAGRLRRVPVVVFYDTEFAHQTNRWVYPLAHSVVTPDCYQGRVAGSQITYPGYHELAYLHPERFAPDPDRLASFGIEPGEPFSVMRFVSWQAVHDTREVGLTTAQKRELVDLLAETGRVVISSEAPPPNSLAGFEARGPVADIHHLLAAARIVVGESATMSSEAAVLGVPAVMIATTGRGYTDDQERRYGLVRHFTEDQFPEACRAIAELLASDPRAFGRQARARLLTDKIDVTAWMVDYFESAFAAGAGTRA